MTETTYFTGGAIKALGDGQIGGYLVVWGSPDQRDAHGEFFTKETDLGLDWYDRRPTLYHHGLGSAGVTPIGIITELLPDEHGLYAKAILDINHEDPEVREYARRAYDMVLAGKLGWSSGSAPNLVTVADNGQIIKWPIVEGSLTPSPAERGGRTTAEAIRSATKALLFPAPDLEAVEIPKEPVAKVETDTPPKTALKTYKPNPQGRFKMDMNLMMQAYEKAGLSPEQIVAVLKELGTAESTEEPVAEVVEAPEGEAVMADDVAPDPATEESVMTRAKGDGNINLTPKQFASMVKEAMKTAPAPAKNFPRGVVGENPAAVKKAPANQIQVRSKYHDLSAEDMQYYSHLVRAYNKSADNPMPELDEKYHREMVVKAKQSYTKGDLQLDHESGQRLMAIKDNEADNTGVAASAGDWVPTLWSSDLWRRVRVDNNIAPQFRVVEMPSNVFELPVESTDPTVYHVPETTNAAQYTLTGAGAIPQSLVLADKTQLTASKLALQTLFSAEIMEDSIIQFIPQLREQAIRSMANAVDNVFVNGDTATGTGNINKKGGTVSAGATDKYTVFNGLRKLALVTNTAMGYDAMGSAPTLQAIRQLRFLMQSALNVYANRPDQLCIFTDVSTYGKMLNIDELLVWANNGRGSTVTDGIVPTIDGIPVYASAEIGLSDATGYVDVTASANDFGTLILAAKPAWTVGYRRQVTSSVDYLPYYDAYVLTATLRLAFINKDTIASAVMYNIGLS